MRLTIIVDDRTIIIDGEGLSDIQQDLSWIPDNIHALQWYDTYGEVEFRDDSLNEIIDDLGIYSKAIECFEEEKKRLEIERIRKEEEIEASRDYWSEFLMIRNAKLFESDWTQSIDAPLTEAQKEEWRIYRQELRDMPESVTDPRSFVHDIEYTLWPQKPQ